jgi:hypothetical protein
MKSKLLKIAALIALFVILSGLVTIRPDDSSDPSSSTADNSTGEAGLDADQESDRSEGERVMRSFTSTYNSYRYGDVSNIIALYPNMCTNLEIAEKARVENLQKNFGNFQGYVTAESQVKESEVKSYDENNIVVRVVIEKITWNGALLPDAGKAAGAYKLVDKDGQPYAGDKYDLKTGTVTEIYKVTGVKEMAEWKVCGFEKVN